MKISSNLNELWTSGDLTQKKKLQNLVFPSGIGYDKLKGEVRTKKVNSIFASIPLISKDLAQIKNGESINYDQFSAKVTSEGQSSNFLNDLNHLKNLEFKPVLKPPKSGSVALTWSN